MNALVEALNRGALLQRDGRLHDALALYGELAMANPGHAEPVFRLATVQSELGMHDAALACVDSALRMERRPVFRFARADILERMGRPADALLELQSLVADATDFAPAFSRLGELLLDAGRFGEALTALRRAATLRPRHVPTLNNLALACLQSGEAREAESAARAALDADPAHGRARATLTHSLLRQAAYTRAEVELSRAAQSARDPVLWLELANVRLNLGRATEALAAFDRAIALAPPDLAQIESSRLLAMHYEDRLGAAEIFEAHRAWAARHGNREARRPRRRPGSDRPLRIGYVSPRLHHSSPAMLLAGVLESHDRQAFEIVCYACSDHEDDMTLRMRRAATSWRRAVDLEDGQLADLMRQDGIDIAVDLAGHTPGNRLGAFVMRPAPLAMTWLDYFDTTGVAAVDALITDRWHSPPGDAQPFSETLVRLPGLRLCWEPPRDAPEVSPLPSSRGRPFTFGSFNRLAKLSPHALALWCEVLRAVPASRMLIKSPSLDSPEEHAPLRERFRRHGIDPERIEIRGQSDHRRMLQEYSDIDVALDSFPYSGCIVTLEALWMGRPVLALRGSTFVSRQSSAILACAGQDPLIASDDADFVSKAAGLARDGEALARISGELRGRVRACGITDARGFTRGLEHAYRQLWQRDL